MTISVGILYTYIYLYVKYVTAWLHHHIDGIRIEYMNISLLHDFIIILLIHQEVFLLPLQLHLIYRQKRDYWSFIWIYICLYVNEYINACIFILLYMHEYIYMHECIHVYTNTHEYLYMYIYIYINTYMNISVRIEYMYKYIYT
jgi:hypothetical protein